MQVERSRRQIGRRSSFRARQQELPFARKALVPNGYSRRSNLSALGYVMLEGKLVLVAYRDLSPLSDPMVTMRMRRSDEPQTPGTHLVEVEHRLQRDCQHRKELLGGEVTAA